MSNRVIYEVNLKIDPEIYEEFIRWLPDHVAALMKIDGFSCGTVSTLDDEEGTGWKQVCCEYILQSAEHMKNYFDNHATAMRADGLTRFGDKFKASRRIKTVLFATS